MNLKAVSDLKNVRPVCVLGAGFMGCVIAVIYKRCGYDVVVCDTSEEALSQFAKRASPIAEIFDDVRGQTQEFLEGIRKTTSLRDAVSDAFLVHEVVQENLELKQNVVKQIEELAPKDAVIATNTSSYLISEVSELLSDKSRLIGLHFVTPAHIIRAIEVIYSDQTDQEVVSWGRSFVESIGYVGIVCRERAGFIVNRLQYALLNEAYQLVDEGYVTAEDIDAAVRLSIGPRLALWGPLLTEDLVVHKKTALAVAEYLGSSPNGPTFHVDALRKHLAKGTVGAIEGEGWYKWVEPYDQIVQTRDRQMQQLLDWLGNLNAVDAIGIDATSTRD